MWTCNVEARLVAQNKDDLTLRPNLLHKFRSLFEINPVKILLQFSIRTEYYYILGKNTTPTNNALTRGANYIETSLTPFTLKNCSSHDLFLEY